MSIEGSDGPLTCANLTVALLLAADGELSNTEWLVVEQHLAVCTACRAQSVDFAQTDRRLLESAADLNAIGPADGDARIRLVSALSDRRGRKWVTWFQPSRKSGWAAVAFAGLSLLIAASTIIATWNSERRRAAAAEYRSRSFPAADLTSGNAEVIRVHLPLAPVGDPFLDGSQSESLVLADVAVGSDGQPRSIRLAE